MKVEVEKKITITEEGGDPEVIFEDTVASESKDLSAVMDMINVGQEQMDGKSNTALLMKIDEIIKAKNN
jgi:hypothetical protein